MSSYRARLEADKKKGQRKADDFNASYPIGTPVIAYPGIRPEHPVAVAYRKRAEDGRSFGDADPCKRLETVTRTPAWTLGHGEPVVSVEGYAGGICLTHIDVIPSPTAAVCRCDEPDADPYSCEADDCHGEFSELNPFGGGPVHGHDAKVSRICECGWRTSVWHVADGSAEEELHRHIARAHDATPTALEAQS